MNWLTRRDLLKFLSLLPFLRKLFEPAPEVVQPLPAPHNRRNECRCAHCSYLRKKYGLVGVFVGNFR